MNIQQIEKELYNSIYTDNIDNLNNLDKNKREDLSIFVKMLTEKLKQFRKFFQICDLYNIFNDAFNSTIVIDNIYNVYKTDITNIKRYGKTELYFYHSSKFLENYKHAIPNTFFNMEERLSKVEKDLNKKDNNNIDIFKQLMLVFIFVTEISTLVNTTKEYFETRGLNKAFAYINKTLNICNATLNVMLDICEGCEIKL